MKKILSPQFPQIFRPSHIPVALGFSLPSQSFKNPNSVDVLVRNSQLTCVSTSPLRYWMFSGYTRLKYHNKIDFFFLFEITFFFLIFHMWIWQLLGRMMLILFHILGTMEHLCLSLKPWKKTLWGGKFFVMSFKKKNLFITYLNSVERIYYDWKQFGFFFWF